MVAIVVSTGALSLSIVVVQYLKLKRVANMFRPSNRGTVCVAFNTKHPYNLCTCHHSLLDLKSLRYVKLVH